jgi:hypothetical protein
MIDNFIQAGRKDTKRLMALSAPSNTLKASTSMVCVWWSVPVIDAVQSTLTLEWHQVVKMEILTA